MVTMGLCDEEKSIDEPEVYRQRCDNTESTPRFWLRLKFGLGVLRSQKLKLRFDV
jgi:hypothetical protein